MTYSKHSLSQKRKGKLTMKGTPWAFKEGVFLSPNGKYIARVKDSNGYTTLSQHDTEVEAQIVYDNFYSQKPSNERT